LVLILLEETRRVIDISSRKAAVRWMIS